MTISMTLNVLATLLAIVSIVGVITTIIGVRELKVALLSAAEDICFLSDQIDLLKGQLIHKSNQLEGLLLKTKVEALLAKKLSERAFTMGSQSQVTIAGVASVLQRRPQPLSKEELAKNEVIQQRIREAFGEEQYEYIKPLMSDEDLELLDEVLEKKRTHHV